MQTHNLIVTFDTVENGSNVRVLRFIAKNNHTLKEMGVNVVVELITREQVSATCTTDKLKKDNISVLPALKTASSVFQDANDIIELYSTNMAEYDKSKIIKKRGGSENSQSVQSERTRENMQSDRGGPAPGPPPGEENVNDPATPIKSETFEEACAREMTMEAKNQDSEQDDGIYGEQVGDDNSSSATKESTVRRDNVAMPHYGEDAEDDKMFAQFLEKSEVTVL
jgi:hypothetical protein